MVRIKTSEGQAATEPVQDNNLGQRITDGRLVPIISGDALEDMVLNGHDKLVSHYAKYISYPLNDQSELHKMAKYQSLIKEFTDQELKADYLDVVASHILALAEEGGIPSQAITEARAQSEGLKVSGFAKLLGFPRLGAGATNPLEILANLKLPIFITTSPYTFIEEALRNAGKNPQNEFCRWHAGLDGFASILTSSGNASDYKPTHQEPLVYHLYGLDKHEESLVLTEDDYLDFLMAVSQGRGKDVDPVHSIVKGALESNALLLMGFSLPSWSFRTLYRGLIKPMSGVNVYQRYCCLQVVPDEAEKRYYESYLKGAHFGKPYWKTINDFCREDL